MPASDGDSLLNRAAIFVITWTHIEQLCFFLFFGRVMMKHCTVLLLALFLTCSSVLAAPKKALKPKIIEGGYSIVGDILEARGACHLINANEALLSAMQIDVQKKKITVHSAMTLNGKLKKKGRYYASERVDLAPTSYLRETLKGKFKKNKQTKKVTFKGKQIFESLLGGIEDCYLKYDVTYQQF